MIPVSSSDITAYEYDQTTGTLSIQFVKSVQIYNYFDVPEATVRDFEAAESKGKFFYANIKGKFQFEKRAA